MATVIIPNFNTQKTMVGLNTYQYTIGSNNLHTARIVVSHHQTSNLTVSIVQAGSVNATLATATVQPQGSTVTDSQSSVILTTTANCQSGDTISFVLTSSASTDQQLNNIKSDMIVTVGTTA
jgi:hypothetical protein